MPTVMLGVFDRSGQQVAIGAPTHLVGNVLLPVTPDPVPANGGGAGLIDSAGTDVEVTYAPTIAAPAVTFMIDIWARAAKLEKLIVTTNNPAFPIEGRWQDQGGGNYVVAVTIG